MAALLELAESEFLDIRKQRTNYQKSVAVRVEAKVPDLPIDAVSLKAFIEQEPLVGKIDKLVADVFGINLIMELPDKVLDVRLKGVNGMGIPKLRELRDALTKYGPMLPEFVRLCRAEVWSTQPVPRGVNLGVSIYQLGLFLAGMQGRDKVMTILKTVGADQAPWDVDRLVAIARRVLANYPAGGASTHEN